MERRLGWEASTGQEASQEAVSVQARVMGAWMRGGAGGWWVGRVRSEERPNDLFRVDPEAVGNGVGQA